MDGHTPRTLARTLCAGFLAASAGLGTGCESLRGPRKADPLAPAAPERGSMVSKFFGKSTDPQGVRPPAGGMGADVVVRDPSKRGKGLSAEAEVAYANAYNDSAYIKHTAVERDVALDTARQKYQVALKLDPKNRSGLIGLARFYASTNDKASAVATLKTAIGYYPTDHELHHRLAAVHFQFREPAEAAVAAQQALALDPSNRTYLKTLAVSQAHSNQYEAAFGTLVSSHVMSESEARNFLGRVLYDLGRPDEGREQITAAIALDPTNAQAKQFLSDLANGGPPTGDALRQAGFEQTDPQ